MGESLVCVQNKILTNKTLNVSADIDPTCKLVLDREGKVVLNENAAKILAEIPGFEIVGREQESEAPPAPASKVEDESFDAVDNENGVIDENASVVAIEPTGKDEAPVTEQNDVDREFPEGEPNAKWKVPELIAWLNKLEPKPEFDPKARKEVLLGIAFKYLETANNNIPANEKTE